MITIIHMEIEVSTKIFKAGADPEISLTAALLKQKFQKGVAHM